MSTSTNKDKKDNNSKVTPGEVCSIDVARKLLGNPAANVDGYFTGNLNMKTFNPSLDALPGRSDRVQLCQQGVGSSDKYYPQCALAFSLGQGGVIEPSQYDGGSNAAVWLTRSINGKEQSNCITSQCPTGFIDDGKNCGKQPMLRDYKKNKSAYCDERFYDWYTIPNYHLGNKYTQTSNLTRDPVTNTATSNIIRCYRPCPSGQVPLYRVDPVDGEAMADEVNIMNTCVSKSQYFNEKYNGTDDYCPLAVIHQIATTKEDIQKTMTSLYGSLDGTSSTEFSEKTSEAQKSADAQRIFNAKQQIGFPQSVQQPNDFMQRACSQLETPERVKYAYEKCKLLRDQGDAVAAEQLLSHVTTNRTAAIKSMKQACNAVFCNPESTALMMYPTDENDNPNDPICFTNIDGTPDIADAVKDPYDESTIKEPIKVKEVYTTLPYAVQTAIALMFLPLILYALYYMYKYSRKGFRWVRRHVIRPFIKTLHLNIWCKLTGDSPDCGSNGPSYDLADKLDALADLEDEREELRRTIELGLKKKANNPVRIVSN